MEDLPDSILCQRLEALIDLEIDCALKSREIGEHCSLYGTVSNWQVDLFILVRWAGVESSSSYLQTDRTRGGRLERRA